MSDARRIRRAAAQGKRPDIITVKRGGRRRAPLCQQRNYTAVWRAHYPLPFDWEPAAVTHRFNSYRSV